MTSPRPGSGAELRAQISEEYNHYRRDWTRPGFRAMAVYRFGSWTMRIERKTAFQKLRGRVFDMMHMVLHRYVRNHHGIEIHRTATIGRNVRLPHQGGIVLHRYAIIGDDCVIQHGVTIGSAGRGVTKEEAPRVGQNVTIAPGAVILGKVTIGENARIGPNVVLYTDVPAGASVVPGSPRMIYAPGTRKRSEMKSSQRESDD